MEFKDYYETLGVAKDASQDDIRKAFRKLARKYHPDVSKEPDAAAKMAALNEANTVLSDPEKRAAYDELGRQPQARAGQDFRPPPDWDAGFEFTGGAGPGAHGADFSDFFEQMFGRTARGHRADPHGPGGARAGPVTGESHHAKIELDLLDAYQGGERTLSLRGARVDDHGQLVHDTRQLHVRIPKGVREGQQIRLGGQGGPSLNGGPPGDLLLEVVFAPDPRWRAEGRDVHQRLRLAPWEAALGGPLRVATPGGDAEVTVPAGVAPGKKLRLKGRGIPSKEPGDLYLEVEIAWPPADSESARAAYAALGKAFPGFEARDSQGA